ncbi:MAG: hypothetical protein ACLT5A_10735, partial [Clostridiaceae bacterium]
EPAFPAWEASVLPMNHICVSFSDTRIIAHFHGFYKDFSGKLEEIVLVFPTTYTNHLSISVPCIPIFCSIS